MSEERLKGWNHLPEIPLKLSALFVWPPDPVEVAKLMWHSWSSIPERLIIFGIAILCYLWLSPALDVTKTFEENWIMGK